MPSQERDRPAKPPVRDLTPDEAGHLRAIVNQPGGRLRRGWGGYGSTRIIRDLEADGYIRVRWSPSTRKGRPDVWEASLSSKGQEWLLDHPDRPAKGSSKLPVRVPEDDQQRAMLAAAVTGMDFSAFVRQALNRATEAALAAHAAHGGPLRVELPTKLLAAMQGAGYATVDPDTGAATLTDEGRAVLIRESDAVLASTSDASEDQAP